MFPVDTHIKLDLEMVFSKCALMHNTVRKASMNLSLFYGASPVRASSASPDSV